jgi:ankyrin repeat protein
MNAIRSIVAAEVGSKRATQVLLRYKASLDVCNVDSYTPLMVVVEQGKLEVANMLFEVGADVNIADQYSYYIVYLVALGRYELLLKTLQDIISYYIPPFIQ